MLTHQYVEPRRQTGDGVRDGDLAEERPWKILTEQLFDLVPVRGDVERVPARGLARQDVLDDPEVVGRWLERAAGTEPGRVVAAGLRVDVERAGTGERLEQLPREVELGALAHPRWNREAGARDPRCAAVGAGRERDDVPVELRLPG